MDILWIDYEGKHVKYATLKNKGEVMEMRTYVTHPWVFQDADTGDQLVTLGGGEVFFPKEPLDDDEDRPDRVLVGIPGELCSPNVLQETIGEQGGIQMGILPLWCL